MFIREVIKSKKGSSKKFVYHLLVESYRSPKGPRQRTLLSLGKLELPRQQWKALANRIEEIISGQLSFSEPVGEEIETPAQHYAQLLIHKKLNQSGSQPSGESHLETVDVNSLQSSQCRSIGAEWVSLAVLQRLGFESYLEQLGFNEIERKIALLLIVARMVAPGSDWRTWQWARQRSAIGELLEPDIKNRSHNLLYQVGDRLYAHKQELEPFLVKREQELFHITSHIILYDLTNTYFEGSIADSKLKRHGHSKEKRQDCLLVTVGLVLNSYRFPLYSRVFEGNVSEQKTLLEMLESLQAPVSVGTSKPLVVLDAGMATEANLQKLGKRGYDYVVVSRRGAPLR